MVIAAGDYSRNRRAWLDARRDGLGASDMSAVLGLNPWKTALDVWIEKTSAEPPETRAPSTAAEFGNRAEDLVARWTVERFPRLGVLVPSPGLLRHPAEPWMLATIDRGLRERGNPSAPVSALLEVKTTRERIYQRHWPDGVPPAYVQVQCQQQMAVTGAPVTWVACLVGGSELADPFPVHRSDAVIGQLIDYGGRWWRDFVVAGVRPDPVFADRDKMAALFPADDALDSVTAGPDLEAAVAELIDARRVIKDGEAREAAAVFRLQDGMRERTAITSPGGDVLVTWKPQTSRRLDQKALAAAHPDLVEQFKPAKTSRVLRVKAKDEQ